MKSGCVSVLLAPITGFYFITFNHTDADDDDADSLKLYQNIEFHYFSWYNQLINYKLSTGNWILCVSLFHFLFRNNAQLLIKEAFTEHKKFQWASKYQG